MLVYQISQIDGDGNVLDSTTVHASNYNAALRELKSLQKGCQKIEVLNSEGEKAGEVGASYWQQRVRRK